MGSSLHVLSRRTCQTTLLTYQTTLLTCQATLLTCQTTLLTCQTTLLTCQTTLHHACVAFYTTRYGLQSTHRRAIAQFCLAEMLQP